MGKHKRQTHCDLCGEICALVDLKIQMVKGKLLMLCPQCLKG